MPDSRTLAIRSEIAQALREAIEKQKFSSIAEAAKDIGISRQRLHAYLEKQATPHADILLVTIKKWKMRLQCLDVEFTSAAPNKSQLSRAVAPRPLQLNLFDAPTVLQNDIVHVRVGRKQADSLKLSLEIRLRA